MENLLLKILEQGGFAVVAIIAIWFAIKKDRQASSLYERLEAKSEKYVQKYAKLSSELEKTISVWIETLEKEDNENGGD